MLSVCISLGWASIAGQKLSVCVNPAAEHFRRTNPPKSSPETPFLEDIPPGNSPKCQLRVTVHGLLVHFTAELDRFMTHWVTEDRHDGETCWFTDHPRSRRLWGVRELGVERWEIKSKQMRPIERANCLSVKFQSFTLPLCQCLCRESARLLSSALTRHKPALPVSSQLPGAQRHVVASVVGWKLVDVISSPPDVSRMTISRKT